MNTSLDAMSDLVGQYLRVRRALGYKLNNAEDILNRFVAYLEVRDADRVSVADAVGFATAPPARTARTQALRLSAVRCFTRWAHCQDPSIEVPPARLLPARPSRVAPYIYTAEQLDAIRNDVDLSAHQRDAVESLRIVLAADESIKTGRAVHLHSPAREPQAKRG